MFTLGLLPVQKNQFLGPKLILGEFLALIDRYLCRAWWASIFAVPSFDMSSYATHHGILQIGIIIRSLAFCDT